MRFSRHPFYDAAPDSELQTLAATEQWGVLMRVGLFGGVILASPVILYQLWAFITPALTSREKKWAFPIVGALVLLLVTGVLFGYWTLPRGLEFLLDLLPDVENNLRLGDYYSFVLRFLLAFGIAFLYPVFLVCGRRCRCGQLRTAGERSALGRAGGRHRGGTDHPKWRRADPDVPLGSTLFDVRDHLLAGPTRAQEVSDPLKAFWGRVGFEPDAFQVDAANTIRDGMSVVVTAPTGSGKTLIAEAAIHLSLEEGRRAFYTTPIKALSNQKFADLAQQHGADRVGLLTGDNVVNPGGRVIVATLEVLRNMIYADPSQLDDVGVVILDEAHYLQDRSRGAGWEEVIIHCPSHVQFVCLSATISNNAQFADWVGERRGPTRLISTHDRPVPLESMYMIKDKQGAQTMQLLPTFTVREGRRRPNPRIEHMMGLERGRRRRFKTPNRFDTVETLAQEGMLPAIYFIFSRAGCDAAAHRPG